jgi:hypothetical protein
VRADVSHRTTTGWSFIGKTRIAFAAIDAKEIFTATVFLALHLTILAYIGIAIFIESVGAVAEELFVSKKIRKTRYTLLNGLGREV